MDQIATRPQVWSTRLSSKCFNWVSILLTGNAQDVSDNAMMQQHLKAHSHKEPESAIGSEGACHDLGPTWI